MSPPRSPVTTTILELLADGQWHQREEVFAAAIAVIPPGRAHRVGERERRRDNPTGLRIRGDQQTAINTGGRVIARGLLASAVHRYGIERRDTDGRIEYRRLR